LPALPYYDKIPSLYISRGNVRRDGLKGHVLMRNLYLVGFMGTGKTAVAGVLSSRLGLKLADMDKMIEEQEGMAVREIFRTRGEPYFRDLEKALVSRLAAQQGYVVACGGGVFADPVNIGLMKKSGTVVCLTSRPETILRRTSRNKERPLLDVVEPLAAIEGLLKKRQACYSQAHYTVDCDALSVEESAQAVLEILKKS